MINLKDEILFIEKELNTNLESIILFGLYARKEQNEKSDIDLLIITNKKISETKIEKNIQKINPKISLLVLTKEEFKERIYNFNHQLLTLFYDGKIIIDNNKFYYKMENLYLALYRKKKIHFKI